MRDYIHQTALMAAYVFKKNRHHDRFPDVNYTSSADYVLDRGRAFVSEGGLTDEQFAYLTEIAEDARDALPGRMYAPKQCFANAQVLVLADEPANRITYCEGYVDTGGMLPVLHGWNLLDGKLVDLTRSLRPEAVDEFLACEPPQADLRDRVLGTLPEGWQYLGVEFAPADTIQHVRDVEQYAPMLHEIALWEAKRRGVYDAPDPDWWERRHDPMSQ
jgi:hypothetical protein